MVGEVYFVIVFCNGVIGGGETRVDFGGVGLTFLANEGTIFCKEEIPGEERFFGNLVGF